MLKTFISEQEFDKLSDQTQRNYGCCKHCGGFYLRAFTDKCICEEG